MDGQDLEGDLAMYEGYAPYGRTVLYKDSSYAEFLKMKYGRSVQQLRTMVSLEDDLVCV